MEFTQQELETLRRMYNEKDLQWIESPEGQHAELIAQRIIKGELPMSEALELVKGMNIVEQCYIYDALLRTKDLQLIQPMHAAGEITRRVVAALGTMRKTIHAA